MQRVDGNRFQPRRRLRLWIWLGIGFVVLAGILLGLLAPQAPTTIEIWTGAGAIMNGW